MLLDQQRTALLQQKAREVERLRAKHKQEQERILLKALKARDMDEAQRIAGLTEEQAEHERLLARRLKQEAEEDAQARLGGEIENLRQQLFNAESARDEVGFQPGVFVCVWGRARWHVLPLGSVRERDLMPFAV